MKILALFLACASVAASAQMPYQDLLKMKVEGGGHRVSYGTDPLQFGELRVPQTAGTHPVAIIVHGGCWEDTLAGLDSRATTYELLRPLAAALAAQGIATWNIEYRRAGSPGGGWPATFLDLAAATDHLRRLAPEYRLDLHRIVIAGHSSGGQLGIWMAARPKISPSSAVYTKNALPVRAVVDVDGPPEAAAAEPVEDHFCPAPGLKDLFGGTAQEQPLRYSEGSGETYLPLGVPVHIVEGALLQHVPELVSQYQSAATAKGDAVTVFNLSGSGHFDMLNPENKYGKQLMEAVVAAVAAKP